eukprot:Gb_35170 [translate_table: standard]
MNSTKRQSPTVNSTPTSSRPPSRPTSKEFKTVCYNELYDSENEGGERGMVEKFGTGEFTVYQHFGGFSRPQSAAGSQLTDASSVHYFKRCKRITEKIGVYTLQVLKAWFPDLLWPFHRHWVLSHTCPPDPYTGFQPAARASNVQSHNRSCCTILRQPPESVGPYHKHSHQMSPGVSELQCGLVKEKWNLNMLSHGHAVVMTKHRNSMEQHSKPTDLFGKDSGTIRGSHPLPFFYHKYAHQMRPMVLNPQLGLLKLLR